jgi:hypothetical protein
MNKDSLKKDDEVKKEDIPDIQLNKAESIQVSTSFQPLEIQQPVMNFNDMSPFGKSFSPNPVTQGFSTDTQFSAPAEVAAA